MLIVLLLYVSVSSRGNARFQVICDANSPMCENVNHVKAMRKIWLT